MSLASSVRSVTTLALLAPAALGAQIRASELATVSQTVDGTVIALEYYRPRVRGRDSVFGREVKWEEVWTPGANWATTLDVSKDISLEGQAVPKGRYSMWMTVTSGDQWTLLLDPRAHRFHTNRPDTVAGQIRLPIKATKGPATEVLTWSFSAVRSTGATLTMQWAETRVDLDVVVPPSYSLTIPEARAQPYLGSYSFNWTEAQDWDSAGAKGRTLTISYRNGSLTGTFTPELWPGAHEAVFLPIAEQWYIIAFLDEKGEVYDVDKDIVFEFATSGQTVTGYEARETSDKVFAKGERRK